MNYSPHYFFFPDLIEGQTRSVIIRNDPNRVPDGDYVFVEVFCTDKTCDCRRSMLNVEQMDPAFPKFRAATISYGWEPMSFYKNWSPLMPPKMLEEFKGPCLDTHQPQSRHALFFLDFFKSMIATDTTYRNRLKTHYAQFKWAQGAKISIQMKFDPLALCPCNSGAKFKFCCGKKGRHIFEANKLR